MMCSPFLRLLLLLAALSVVFPAAPASAQLLPGMGSPNGSETAEGDTTETTLRSLIEVLRDDSAREELIAELESALAAAEDGEGTAAGDESASLELRSIGGEIASITQSAAETAMGAVTGLFSQIVAAPAAFGALSLGELRIIGGIILNLAVLLFVTYGGLLGVQFLTERVRRQLREDVERDGYLAQLFAIALGFVIDITPAVVAWALGYFVALIILGQPGQVSLSHSLYLNAFFLIELVMAVLRVVFAPRRSPLRLVDVGDEAARRVMGWGRVITTLFVYGLLLLLPLVNRLVSAETGRALSTVVLLAILGIVAILVARMRKPVAHRLARRWRTHRASKSKRLIARYWTVPVQAYLVILAFLAISRPLDGFYGVLVANGQIAVAVLVGMIVVNLISRMLEKGIDLPPQIVQRVPLLQSRLNAFVPRILNVLRVVVIAAVVIFSLHLLGVIDFFAVIESQTGARFAATIGTVGMILLVALLLWLVLNSWVEYQINPEYTAVVSARKRTLLVLMRNALTIALSVIVLMFVLAELGLNIAPLLASAGVIGLAIGFGAQKAVQDIITGVFIQLEGAVDVGDVVQIGGITGVVERLTVRSAALRDLEGAYHIIPFSSVDVVTNFMRGFSFALLDIGVAYREDTEEARKAMFDAFEELKEDPENGTSIIDELEWMGLNEFGSSEVVLRARIKTVPGKQWGVKRAYNAILKRVFDERNIEIPFPHQTVYFGVDKLGKAPPARILRETQNQRHAVTPGQTPPKNDQPPQSDEVGLPSADEGSDAEH